MNQLFTAARPQERTSWEMIRKATATLAAFYGRHRKLLVSDLVCRLSRTVLQLAIPMVALKVFQEYLPNRDLQATAFAALVFACLALSSAALEWAGTICGQWLGFRIEADMRKRMFDHIESLPFAYFDRTKTGEILSRITGDLRQIGMTAHLLPEALLEITLTLLGAFAVMFWLNPVLAAITLIPIPFILLFAGAFQKRIHAVWRGNRQDAAAFAAHVENAVAGIREVKSFTCEDRERRAFNRVNTRFRKSFERMSKLYGPINSGTQLMVEGYSLLYIAVGAWMTVNGSADIAEVFAFYMYSRYVTMPMMRAVNFLDMFQQGLVGCRRYLELMEEEPEHDSKEMRYLTDVAGEIVFKNIRFRYEESDRDILNIPSLTIPAGSVTAFVGPSGGGKSTVAALIPRFYEPICGEINLDGSNIADLSKKSLRSKIGIVAQRPFLFDGTIRENLKLGDPRASEEDIFAALEGANLADFVRSLPKGLETEVGERGVKLSGGQAQRIAIARVFLKNPAILILDEATSALDTFSEAAVHSALMNLSNGRTTLVIAHRLSTIRHATTIIYLEAGKIVESGSHEDLMRLNGKYHALQALSSV